LAKFRAAEERSQLESPSIPERSGPEFAGSDPAGGRIRARRKFWFLRFGGLSRKDSPKDTFIQRFGSAANLNIHLHCLVLDRVYRRTADEPVFQASRAPITAELQGLIIKFISRIIRVQPSHRGRRA
jgi:hypothetical protein